jgi:rubrerythrin
MCHIFRHRLARALAAVVAASGTIALALPAANASAGPLPVEQLLISASKEEAAAYLEYYGYAAGADNAQLADEANVWRTVGDVEHQDHYTHEVTLASLYSETDNAANLETAITQAKQVAHNDFVRADRDPSSQAGRLLRAIAFEEYQDAGLLTRALSALQSGGSIPSAPPVKEVGVQVSPRPSYSGTFYEELTAGSGSALQDSAWLWAEYQFMGKTAVDTGHARLAALLSGLEKQEMSQNWVLISNVAGFVNGVTMNLEHSIADEQGAIEVYTRDAKEAQEDGNPSIASTFLSIRGDEEGHHQTFTTELEELSSTGYGHHW